MTVLTKSEFADKLFVQTIRWTLERTQQVQNLGNGEVLSSDIGPAFWQAQVSLAVRSNEESAEIEALIESLSGSTQAFLFYDPRKQFPISDVNGTTLGSNTVRINSFDIATASLSLKGLPSGYQLNVGDLLDFDYASPARRALHRITEAAVANGSGVTPSFSVAPQIRTGISIDDDVSLVKPSAKMIIIPGTLRVSSTSSLTSQIQFRARQTLRAD